MTWGSDEERFAVIRHEAKEEVLAQILAKANGENQTRTELLQGRRLGEVNEKYGVL